MNRKRKQEMSLKLLAVAALPVFIAEAMADGPEHGDAEIKAQFVFAGRCRHAEDMDSNYDYAFRMAVGDTNRYVRVLSELAEENTNQTRRVIDEFFYRKPPQSLPFLYSYATNAQYGAYALKSIFAIEGVNSNSVVAMQGYLSLTNTLTNGQSHDRSMLCKDFLNNVFSSDELEQFRPSCLSMMIDFAQHRNSGHVSLDGSIQAVDPTYHASKRRLAVLRAAQNRCGNSFQLDYVTNAINELVAYPEANLPD